MCRRLTGQYFGQPRMVKLLTRKRADSPDAPAVLRAFMERRGFVILQNHIANGACEYCHAKTPGVWAA